MWQAETYRLNMKPAPSDVAGLAKYIQSPECRSIGVLTGAGVSVASGIPDFRSSGGLYETLDPDRLTATPEQRQRLREFPSDVVSWELFKENQFPYMECRRPFILGTHEKKWKATIAHRFFELLHTKSRKLTRLYTQNIDGLEYQCDKIPQDKIVAVHGSIAEVVCEGCGRPSNMADFCSAVRTNIKDIYNEDGSAPATSSAIPCDSCDKPLVKPSTVLFGRNLPDQFFEMAERDLPKLDLLIVAGTSLAVSPANELVPNVSDKAVRVVINRERVGMDLGFEYDQAHSNDLFLQGDCDDIFLELIKEMNWLDYIQADSLPTLSCEKVSRAQRDIAYTKWF